MTADESGISRAMKALLLVGEAFFLLFLFYSLVERGEAFLKVLILLEFLIIFLLSSSKRAFAALIAVVAFFVFFNLLIHIPAVVLAGICCGIFCSGSIYVLRKAINWRVSLAVILGIFLLFSGVIWKVSKGNENIQQQEQITHGPPWFV
jgi:hypothetical protein